MKIYILLAHPDKDSFNGRLADAYENAAKNKGHEIRRQNLGEMKFDPILWKGNKVVQELEPDLKQSQENILWCNKWVIFYPLWWGSVPVLREGECRPIAAKVRRSTCRCASKQLPTTRAAQRERQTVSLLGVKRTCRFAAQMSAYDPKRTSLVI